MEESPNALGLFDDLIEGSPLQETDDSKSDFTFESPENPLEEVEVSPEEQAEIASKTVISAFLGEKEVQIDENLTFKIPGEDGRELVFTAKDAVHNYKARNKMDQEFSRLDREQKELQARASQVAKDQEDIALIDKHITEISECGRRGDILGVTKKIAELHGETDSTAMRQLIEKSEEYLDKMQAMDEDEKKAFFDKEDLEIQKRKIETESKKVELEKRKLQEERDIKNLQTQHGISDNELNETWQQVKELDAERERLGQPSVLKGKSTKQLTEITVSFLKAKRTDTLLASLVKETVGDRADVLDYVISLNVAHKSPEEIKKIIKVAAGVLGEKAAEGDTEDSKEVQDVGQTSALTEALMSRATSKTAPQGPPKAEKESPGGGAFYDFDDLIAKYESEEAA